MSKGAAARETIRVIVLYLVAGYEEVARKAPPHTDRSRQHGDS